jgi:hopanoid biosynthesis associated protein HpnK
LRRLIINADDFGLTSGINRAIVEGHQQGVVTSATLMANGPEFQDAVQLSRSVPKLSVGCHIVLTDGPPILDASQVSTLVEGQSPRFRDPLSKFVLAAIAGRLDEDQIEAEAQAQIRKLQSAGVAVSHFDSHKHTHLLPQILRPLLRAAKACGVRAVRNPFGPVRFGAIRNRPKLWKRYCEFKILYLLAGKFQRAIQQAGLKTPDGTLGIISTGALDESLFQLILSSLPPGTWEFVCHPGYNDPDLQKVQTRLRESRAQELRILISPNSRQVASEAGIELISYQDFVRDSA